MTKPHIGHFFSNSFPQAIGFSPSRACDEHGFALRDGRLNMLLLVSPFYWSEG